MVLLPQALLRILLRDGRLSLRLPALLAIPLFPPLRRLRCLGNASSWLLPIRVTGPSPDALLPDSATKRLIYFKALGEIQGLLYARSVRQHGQFPFLGLGVAVFGVVVGGVKFIVTPRVFRTVSTLPTWQVGLPCSTSMMKRRPVPEVMARSFWVAPICLRTDFTISPICFGVYFMVSTVLPYGNIMASLGQMQRCYSRTGTMSLRGGGGKTDFPNRTAPAQNVASAEPTASQARRTSNQRVCLLMAGIILFKNSLAS